jgi:hypothetical protein
MDGAVVRGLFSHVPVLVEGAGDRAVFSVFWSALEKSGDVVSAAQWGVEAINTEGHTSMPMLAAVLSTAGKSVVALTERDNEHVNQTYNKLRADGNCEAIMSYPEDASAFNLEAIIVSSSSIDALSAGMKLIAEDRDYDWQQQRFDLMSREPNRAGVPRERLSATESLEQFFELLEDEATRSLIQKALSSRKCSPFDLKGARQARIFCEEIVAIDGVPEPFANALRELSHWVQTGRDRELEVFIQ